MFQTVLKLFPWRTKLLQRKYTAMKSVGRRWSCLIPAFVIEFVVLLVGAVPGHGFALNGYTWAPGTQVQLHLELSRASVGLQDGSASWNDSATDAINLWNQYVDVVKLVAAPGVSPADDDGVCSVFFSDAVYGDTWPSGTLAVTLYHSDAGPGAFSETDVIFNNHLNWNSYRGPIQGSGPTATFDFHRVALHEFGHVLGLSHPDEHGQNVVAIMNSLISGLDHLADDDIAGARSLYGARITSSLTPPSVAAETNFSYQITANNNPTSFTAVGLPSGLQLNAATGLISGTPARGGTYNVFITAQGPTSTASATLRITILGPTITSNLSPPGVAVGNDFTYQITTSKVCTAFEATGLPPGLELNPNTGLISGVPTISGTYYITLVAHGSSGDATAHLTLIVPSNPVPSSYDAPSLTLPVGNGPIATDSARSRVYVAHNNSIAVVDTVSPHVVTTIPISDHYNATTLTLSPDGKVLWFVRTNDTIGRIDLETLTALSDLPTNELVLGLREGLDHRLYCPSWSGGMLELDATTGATLTRFDLDPPSPGGSNYCSVEISPDRKTLYVGLSASAPGIHKYDVSTSTPMLLETFRQSGNLGDLGVSHNGTRLCFWTSGIGTNEFDTTNITQPLGLLNYQEPTFNYPIFAQDDSLIFQLASVRNGGPQIAVFDAATRQLTRVINLPPNLFGYRYVGVDASNTYVLVCGWTPNGDPPRLLFYPIHVQTIPVPPHSLLNVSTRAWVQPGDSAEIGGFIVRGTESKKIAVRAIGPSLASFNVSGAMADPVLELHDASNLVAANDNWNSHRTAVIQTHLAPKDEHEAVIVTTVAPGNYTGIVRGVNGTGGVGLFELYDLDPSNSQIANISTRAKIESDEKVLVGGFILGGAEPTNVVIRGIGPSLANFGVSGAITDPILELHDGNGALLAQNDDWRSSQEPELTQSGLAPTDDRESAMLMLLQPGTYTAIIRGKNNATGIGLVEVYNLDAN